MLLLICIYILIFLIAVIIGADLKYLTGAQLLNPQTIGYFKPVNLPPMLGSIVKNNAIAIFTGFWGGLFAGYWGYHYQSRSRNESKRSDKYFEHRNTIVQIEHEMIPIRLNISRNLSSIEDALQNTNQDNTRVVLRFFQLKLSPGLNLKLLNVTMINQYAEVYTLLETINSDFQYTNDLVNQIRSATRPTPMIISAEQAYIQMLSYLKKQCDLADKQTLELLVFCKLSLTTEIDKQKEDYIKNGGEVKYNISKEEIQKRQNELVNEETAPYKDGEARPQFIALYLNIQKVPIPAPPPIS